LKPSSRKAISQVKVTQVTYETKMKSCLILAVLYFVVVDAEIFSAVEGLEKLLKDERKLLKTFDEVMKQFNVTDGYWKEKIGKWINESENAEKNFVEYIGNPLCAFLLIKRMTVDYKQIQNQLGMEIEKFQPDDSDLAGAVEGLLRLQPFYKQKSSDFAKGFIDGVKTREELTAHDLYIIGSEASKINGQEYFAKEYLKLAWEKHLMESELYHEFDETELLAKLVELYENSNDYENALAIVNILSRKHPTEESVENKRNQLLRYYKRFGNSKLEEKNPYIDSFIKTGYYSEENEMVLYGQMCRGEVVKSPKEIAKLYCKYVSNSAFSKIAPFKAEVANLDPYVVNFIDVISDTEIEILKNISRPNIERAKIMNNEGESRFVSNRLRVAQIAWFFDEDHEIVQRISQRIEVSKFNNRQVNKL
jgi:prolyl 4-hydroxylase